MLIEILEMVLYVLIIGIAAVSFYDLERHGWLFLFVYLLAAVLSAMRGIRILKAKKQPVAVKRKERVGRALIGAAVFFLLLALFTFLQYRRIR